MDDALLTAFPLIMVNHCLESSTASEFYVYDEATMKRCQLSFTEPREQTFKVINPTCKTIRVLAVDHCLLFDDYGKKCDAVLYDDQTVCFLELKEVKEGGDEHQKRRLAKREAKKQLMATLELFWQQLDSSVLANKQLEAYLCVGYRPTRPATLSQSQAAQREFAERQVTLFDGCQKEF